MYDVKTAMSRADESVLFIVEIEKCLLISGVLILNSQSGPMDEQVLMCRYQPVLTHMLEICWRYEGCSCCSQFTNSEQKLLASCLQ